MSLYFIGIGGTGAKCIEAALQLAAVGLYTEDPIKVLFVDSDESNGNLERTRHSLKIYQKCHELLWGNSPLADRQKSPWMKTPIHSFDIWSPLGNLDSSKTLAGIFKYHSLKQKNEAIANLFDILYTEQEREIPLDAGFRGRPALGAAILSQVDLRTEAIWGTILREIEKNISLGENPKILLCGSVFGGTGAAALPTLARLLTRQLPGVKVGGILLLPYFQFSAPAYIAPNAIYARPELFLLNTETSLRYYVTQAQQAFDTTYLLGNPNLTPVDFNLGKNPQCNPPHLVELYAALALRQFLFNPPPEPGTVVLIGRRRTGQLTWSDLPEPETVKLALTNGVRFAHTWLTNLVPALEQAKKIGIPKFQQLAPWFTQFFQPSLGAFGKLFITQREESLPDFTRTEEQEAITIVSNWCQTYWRWLSELHQGGQEDIQLFRPEAEQLSDLLVGDGRDKQARAADTVQRLKAQLTGPSISAHDRGATALAKALYNSCQP